MYPFNYAAFALDHIRLKKADPTISTNDGKHLSIVSNLLIESEKFAFPDAKKAIDEQSLFNHKNLRQPASALAQPVCIEAPWGTRIALTGSNALVQSSKRIALCWEAQRDGCFIKGWGDVFDYYPSGGIFVLPIVWLDMTKRWNVFHTGAFLPHLAYEGISTITGKFEDRVALLPQINYATGQGALLAHPMIFLEGYHSDLQKKSPSYIDDINVDLTDEVLLAAYVMPLLPAATHEIPAKSSDDRKRQRQGKQSFFSYKKINSLMPSGALSQTSSELAHVSSFGLRTLRALNLYEEKDPKKNDPISDWITNGIHYSAAQINLFVGINGSGKSTIIDMIDCLRDATKLSGMQRENTRVGTVSGFFLSLSSVRGCLVTFSQANGDRSKWDMNKQTVSAIIFERNGLKGEQMEIGKFSTSTDEVDGFKKLFEQLNCSVHLYDGREPPGIETKDVIRELCEIGKYLPQTVASTAFSEQDIDRIGLETINYRKIKPFLFDDGDRINVWLGDDSGQTNRVPMHLMPSGWRQYGKLTAWLANCPNGSVCLIDEPETHLHPTLQRLLARRLGQLAKDKSLQLFVATHSPTLMNAQAWSNIVPKVYEMRGDSLTDRPNLAALLRDLGVRLSDLLQANGVVWVEGPSDAIYIRHWIEIYCEKMGRPAPLEESQFSFLLYGGAMLSHFSVGSREELIDMLRLNQNLVVLMDQDLDCQTSQDNGFAEIYPQGTKLRIQEAVGRLGADECWTWITHGYTIESYLPKVFQDKYFHTSDDGRLRRKKKIAKVEIARKFVDEKYDFEGCFEHAHDLREKIAKLIDTIDSWNKV